MNVEKRRLTENTLLDAIEAYLVACDKKVSSIGGIDVVDEYRGAPAVLIRFTELAKK